MLGLWNLGGGATSLILLVFWLSITTLTFTALGPGIGVLISLAFPWHIGSAALAAGELWPGTQEAGLVLVPAMLCRPLFPATGIAGINIDRGRRGLCLRVVGMGNRQTRNELLEVDAGHTAGP